MKKCAALAIIPFLVACSSDEEDLIKQQQQQIQQLQSQLQTSVVQEVTPSLPVPAQYQQTQQYQQAPQYQQPAPVVVQEHNDNGLLGGMAGFMLGHALGNSGGNGSSSTHVERHYITNNTSTSNTSSNRIRDTPRLPTTIRNQPAPVAAPAPAKPSSSFWSSKPSISSGSSRPFSSSSSSSFKSRPSIRRK